MNVSYAGFNVRAEALPGSIPSLDPAFSKMDVYSLTLSGVNGGTLMGPLACGCNAAGGASGGGALFEVVKPSNLGNGPAGEFMGSAPAPPIIQWCEHTSESKLWCRFSSSLRVPDQPQYHPKASRRKQSTVFGVSNLPNLRAAKVSVMSHVIGNWGTSRPLLKSSGQA